MSKITVLGGGGWAIALAMVLNDNGHNMVSSKQRSRST